MHKFTFLHETQNDGFIFSLNYLLIALLICTTRVSWETISRSYRFLLLQSVMLAGVLTSFWHRCRGPMSNTRLLCDF